MKLIVLYDHYIEDHRMYAGIICNLATRQINRGAADYETILLHRAVGRSVVKCQIRTGIDFI